MKIFINALSARIGGGQTYLLNILQNIPEDMDIVLLAPDSLKITNDNPRIQRFPIKETYIKNPILRSMWEKIKLPLVLSDLNIDILFCPGGVVGTKLPKGCKCVTMFRNMMPFDHKQRKKYPIGYERIRHWMLKKIFLKSMLRADLVIFISEYAKQVIESNIGNRIKSSAVIPHGLSNHFRYQENGVYPKPEWLPEQDYILYVSKFEFYKAQLEVIEAYYLLKQRRNVIEKLVLVGEYSNKYGEIVQDRIKQLGIEQDVIITGDISYKELPAVYRFAKINIFASECENCPNILLEALGAGRPVVSSDRPPMPEFGGDAVLYFDPSSPADLADKIELILDSPKKSEEYSIKAKKRSEKYDWVQTANMTWEAIRNLSN